MIERRAGGFTLVEVLIALAMLGLAFGFAMGGFSNKLTRLDHDHKVQSAVLVAQSVLARVGQDIALEDREIGGQRDDGFLWDISITPYGGGPGGVFGHQILVRVGWSEGRRHRQVQLETVRLAVAGTGP